MQLALGQTYRRTVLDEALDRLRETLRDEGLYQAEVLRKRCRTRRRIRWTSSCTSSPGLARELAHPTKERHGISRCGNPLAVENEDGRSGYLGQVQRGTDRIRKYPLAKKGHLSGRAGVRRGNYDSAKNTIPLDLDVTKDRA